MQRIERCIKDALLIFNCSDWNKNYGKELDVGVYPCEHMDNKVKHHPNWPSIPAHPCREGAALGNTNAFLCRINFQLDTYKTYLYAKDRKAKYQFLINKFENVGLKYYGDLKAFIEYSNAMENLYKILISAIQTRDKKY